MRPRQRLLEEGAYQAPDAARAAGARKQALEVVARSIGRGAPVAYHVTDRAPERGSRDWARVVAVFVTGAAWQFKGWPFKARPAAAIHGVPRTRAGHGRRAATARAREAGGISGGALALLSHAEHVRGSLLFTGLATTYPNPNTVERMP